MTTEKIDKFYKSLASVDCAYEGYVSWVLGGGEQHLPEAINDLNHDIEQAAHNIAYTVDCEEVSALEWITQSKPDLIEKLKHTMGQMRTKTFRAAIDHVARAWQSDPSEWDMLGAVEFSNDEVARFEYTEQNHWNMERWSQKEQVWYLALEGLTQDDVAPVIALVIDDYGRLHYFLH